MARPKVDLPDAGAIIALADDQDRLSVRVTPGARQEGIAIEDGHVLVKVRAKPQDGAANKAVCAILAEALGIAPSRIAILRGMTSRDKLVQLG